MRHSTSAFQLELFARKRNDALGSLALCEVVLTGDKPPEWICLIPAGKKIEAADGREFVNTDPEAVVAAFEESPVDLPIDWEHASELKAPEGEQAPAAGWITDMEVRDGAVWGKVAWTSKGQESLTSKAYRYLSPAFIRTKAGKVLKIVSAALTNQPALDMLPALARDGGEGLEFCATWDTTYVNDLSDSCFLLIEAGGKKDADGKTEPRSLRHFPYRDAIGKIDLPHLRNAISRIPQSKITGFDAAAQTALQDKASKLLSKAEGGNVTARLEDTMDPKLLALLGLAADASPEAVLTAVAKMKDDGATSAKKAADTEAALVTARAGLPSLDKFVPRSDYDVALARAKTLEDEKVTAAKKAHDDAALAEVDAAMKAGKVTPSSKDFYVSTCSTAEGLQKFRDFVKTAPVIGEPSKLEGQKPPTGGELAATEEELVIARRCGLTKEQFLAAKKAV